MILNTTHITCKNILISNACTYVQMRTQISPLMPYNKIPYQNFSLPFGLVHVRFTSQVSYNRDGALHTPPSKNFVPKL